MKKRISAFCLLIIMCLMMSSCSIFKSDRKNVGKANDTVVKIAKIMDDKLIENGRKNQSLYGAIMVFDNNLAGEISFVYTDKRPDNFKYNDILMATIDTKSSKITRLSAPSFKKDGKTPYELIKKGYVLDIKNWPVDSNIAIKNALVQFNGDGEFSYDYVLATATSDGSVCKYDIEFISLIEKTKYSCSVDVQSGNVYNILNEDGI